MDEVVAQETTKKKSKKTPKAQDNPIYKRIKKQTDKFSNAVGEIMDQYREFTVGGDPNDRTIRVYPASPKIEAHVAHTYSKVYGKLLQDEDMLPEEQILESLKKRGIWSDQKDKRIESLQQRVGALQATILLLGESEKLTTSEMEKMTNEYQELLEELHALNQKRATFLATSIEMRAQEIKIKDQVWQCTKEVFKDENGNVKEEKPVWNSLDEIDNETDRVLLLSVVNESLAFWQGVPSSLLDDSPETLDGENDTQ